MQSESAQPKGEVQSVAMVERSEGKGCLLASSRGRSPLVERSEGVTAPIINIAISNVSFRLL